MVPPLVPAAVVRHPLRAPFFHNFTRHAVIQSSGRSLPVDREEFRATVNLKDGPLTMVLAYSSNLCLFALNFSKASSPRVLYVYE